MNKNKGIIGIGLIIAIVLGIVIVGGGAYYLGKGNFKKEVKVEENNLPAENNQQVNTPSITVISPNGGEKFNTSNTIEQIPVTWKSSGIVSENVSIFIKNTSTGEELFKATYVPDNGSTNIYGVPPGNYKIRICSTNQKNGDFDFAVSYDPDCGTASDYSDNSFTVNSATTISVSQKCINEATSLLPAYILKQGDYLDFKLNKIELFALRSDASGAQYFTGNPTNDACMVNVNYSVKLKTGAINAGNGHESSDGWIVNKSGYATIDKNSSGYYVSSMGTGY